MNYHDYAYELPRKFSPEFERDYLELKSLKSFESQPLWKKFFLKYEVEAKKAEEILARNASNFMFLCEMREKDLANRALIDGLLAQFRRWPGFFIFTENGKTSFVCNYQKALNIFSGISQQQEAYV